MDLSRGEILQINATVITGLLILLTFQSVSPTITSTEVEQFVNDLNKLSIEEKKLTILHSQCETSTKPYSNQQIIDSNQMSLCDNFGIRAGELSLEMTALKKWGLASGYFSPDGRLSNYVGFSLLTPSIIAGINIIMIFPFIISSIHEVYSARKDKTNKTESVWGLRLLIIGFIVLILGFAIIFLIMVFASTPFMFRSDSDSDFLLNDLESNYGTDPLNPDTDNDGLLDGHEIFNYNTDPLKSDTDNDGKKDSEDIFRLP